MRTPAQFQWFVFTTMALPVMALITGLAGCGTPASKANPESQRTQENASPGNKADARIPAKAGVGKQGRKLKDREGLYVTPLKAFLNVKQTVVFDIQVKQAEQFYNASNGHMPKSHEEYMRDVIEANLIELPALPEGQRYEYDPEQEMLLVFVPGDEE